MDIYPKLIFLIFLVLQPPFASPGVPTGGVRRNCTTSPDLNVILDATHDDVHSDGYQYRYGLPCAAVDNLVDGTVFGSTYLFTNQIRSTDKAAVLDPDVPQIIWGVKTTSYFGFVIFSKKYDQGKHTPSEDEILVSSERFVGCFTNHNISNTPEERYEFRYRVGEGEFGRVYLVRPRCQTTSTTNLVLKRAKAEIRSDAYLAGLRDGYFGKLFRTYSSSPGVNHLPRFIEAFKSLEHLYVVSMFEGISLHAALYASDSAAIQPRAWWRWLKTTPEGNNATKEIMRQMISGLELVHRLNIIHRDLKPGNVAICFLHI